MSSETEDQTRPRSTATWKRALLFGLAFGIGIAGMVVLFAGSIFLYKNRRIPPHTWNTIELKQTGIQASLKTEARDAEVRYQFKVLPLSEAMKNAFDALTSTPQPQAEHFTITFYDEGGFEVCSVDPGALTRIVDEGGKTSGLEANGVLWGCSVNQYPEVKSWNLNYVFPDLKAWTSAATGTDFSDLGGKRVSGPTGKGAIDISAGLVPKVNPTLTPEKFTALQKIDGLPAGATAKPIGKYKLSDVDPEDSITGVASWLGEIETKAGHTFHVSREGERTTIVLWAANDSVVYACQKGECLVSNMKRHETVHATMSR